MSYKYFLFRYIYGGKLSLKGCNTSNIVNLLIAANELNLQELITYIQSFLIENKTNWMESNFNLIYQTSFENNSFLDLQNFCMELLSKQPEKVFNSIDFTSISENSLEVKLWNLIKGTHFCKVFFKVLKSSFE